MNLISAAEMVLDWWHEWRDEPPEPEEAVAFEALQAALNGEAARVKQLEEEIEELDFLLNEGDALGKAERRASVLEKALSELLAANDAVQDVLCDGPNVPGFDPLALGKAQQRVTQAEDIARTLLNGGSNEQG